MIFMLHHINPDNCDYEIINKHLATATKYKFKASKIEDFKIWQLVRFIVRFSRLVSF